MKTLALRFVLGFVLLATPIARAARITVNSAADPAGFNFNITVAQLGATITLRDAVNAARNSGGLNTIVFNASLAEQTINLLHVGDATTASALVGTSNQNIDGHLVIQGLTGGTATSRILRTRGQRGCARPLRKADAPRFLRDCVPQAYQILG